MHSTWTEVVSIIAHDLKTPISSVKGYIELMQVAGELNERQQQFSERALHSLQQMEQLVARLLELSWIDADRPLQRDDCHLAELVARSAELVAELARRRDVTIHLEIEPEVSVVPAESRRIEQVILNLMSNAIKYNRQGGDVWVSVKNKPDGIEVSVRDTGIGIAPEDQPHIFERFYRASVHSGEEIEGTGLGLSIVKAVVEKHHGEVNVESVVGEGTTFRFWLPRVAE